MAFPYDPYVPFDPPADVMRRDTIEHSGGLIPMNGGESLYRVVDRYSQKVVKEGSRDTCLDYAIAIWRDAYWKPEPHSRARAADRALGMSFERWQPLQHQWTQDRDMTHAMVELHQTI